MGKMIVIMAMLTITVMIINRDHNIRSWCDWAQESRAPSPLPALHSSLLNGVRDRAKAAALLRRSSRAADTAVRVGAVLGTTAAAGPGPVKAVTAHLEAAIAKVVLHEGLVSKKRPGPPGLAKIVGDGGLGLQAAEGDASAAWEESSPAERTRRSKQGRRGAVGRTPTPWELGRDDAACVSRHKWLRTDKEQKINQLN